jgi:hypothetical protein
MPVDPPDAIIPPVCPERGDKPEASEQPAGAQWPDSLLFWFAITFAVIVVPALLCLGGATLIRRLF